MLTISNEQQFVLTSGTTSAGSTGFTPGSWITFPSSTSHTHNIVNTAPAPLHIDEVVISAEEFNHEVFFTSLETLVNLWLAKFGDRWVTQEELIDETFFRLSCIRLRRTAKLEWCAYSEISTNMTKFVYRICK